MEEVSSDSEWIEWQTTGMERTSSKFRPGLQTKATITELNQELADNPAAPHAFKHAGLSKTDKRNSINPFKLLYDCAHC